MLDAVSGVAVEEYLDIDITITHRPSWITSRLKSADRQGQSLRDTCTNPCPIPDNKFSERTVEFGQPGVLVIRNNFSSSRCRMGRFGEAGAYQKFRVRCA